MRRSELQDTIRSVIKIFQDYFLSPTLDQSWVQTQFGQMATDRVIRDSNQVVQSFRVFTLNRNLMNVSPLERQTNIDEYVTALTIESSHPLHKCFTRLANDLVINLYCYGINFFVAPYEEPELLQQFVRQYQSVFFRALDSQFASHLAQEVNKMQYFYAITGRRSRYGFKEFAFSSETSTLLQNFFSKNPEMHQWILKNVSNLIAVIKEFNAYRLRSNINPLFVYMRDDEHFSFLLKLFGEWGSQLPMMPSTDLSRLTPFIKFLNHFREDVPQGVQFRLHNQVCECYSKDPQQGRSLLIQYLQTEKFLLKYLIAVVDQLRTLSAIYTAYQTQTFTLAPDVMSERPALRFFTAPGIQSDPTPEPENESAKRARLA